MKNKLIKYVSTVMALSLVVGLGACGQFDADESALKLTDKGEVLTCSIEELDESYYDPDELQDYINETVEEYSSENSDATVEIRKVTIEDNTAKLLMKYGDTQTYADFNNVTFYSGTVAQALAAGYEFDGSFASVLEGASSDAAKVAWSSYEARLAAKQAAKEDALNSAATGDASGDATKDEEDELVAGDLSGSAILTTSLDYNVLIVSEPLLVTVPGEIVFVSAENAKVTATDTVRVTEAENPVYIIYQ